MSPEDSRGQAPTSFDPEAEQEVDFGRYWRLIAAPYDDIACARVLAALAPKVDE